MGNSDTSRYADGKNVHHPQAPALRWVAALAQGLLRNPLEPEGLKAHAVRPPRLGELRRALASEANAYPAEVGQRPQGAARLLRTSDTAASVRRLARRWARDEGDVANVWAATLSRAVSGPATAWSGEAPR